MCDQQVILLATKRFTHLANMLELSAQLQKIFLMLVGLVGGSLAWDGLGLEFSLPNTSDLNLVQKNIKLG